MKWLITAPVLLLFLTRISFVGLLTKIAMKDYCFCIAKTVGCKFLVVPDVLEISSSFLGFQAESQFFTSLRKNFVDNGRFPQGLSSLSIHSGEYRVSSVDFCCHEHFSFYACRKSLMTLLKTRWKCMWICSLTWIQHRILRTMWVWIISQILFCTILVPCHHETVNGSLGCILCAIFKALQLVALQSLLFCSISCAA